MTDPAAGPFLFDTSAESRLARRLHPGAAAWWSAYLAQHVVHVSAVTVLERIRGYSLLWRRAEGTRRLQIEAARIAYLHRAARVWPLDEAIATVAGELMAQMPDPASPPRRSHGVAESRRDRLVRWRFDQMIAATALVTGLSLVHDNAADFEAIRSGVERDPERFPGLGPLELIRCTSLA